MYNFFEFCERLAQEGLINEGLPQPGSPDQYVKGVRQSPLTGQTTARDAITGKAKAVNLPPEERRKIAQAQKIGRGMDRQLFQQRADQALANVERGEADPLGWSLKVNQAIRDDEEAEEEEDLSLGGRQRQGQRVVGDAPSGVSNYDEELLKAQRQGHPAAHYAILIDDVLTSSAYKDEFVGKPLSETELLHKLLGKVRAGGTGDVAQHIQDVRRGLHFLIQTAGNSLFDMADGKLMVKSMGEQRDTEHLWSKQGDLRIYGIFRNIKNRLKRQHEFATKKTGDQNAAYFDPMVIASARDLMMQAELLLKSGRLGGEARDDIQHWYEVAKQIVSRAQSYGR